LPPDQLRVAAAARPHRLFPRAHVPAILVRLSRFAERDAWEHSDAMARLKKGALCSRQVTIR
jgi:hypothetical protein